MTERIICEGSARCREVRIDGAIYRVTSVFTGEIELGPALEKLAAKRVLSEMDARTKAILRS
jgi:hypothetical protein